MSLGSVCEGVIIFKEPIENHKKSPAYRTMNLVIVLLHLFIYRKSTLYMTRSVAVLIGVRLLKDGPV